MADDERSVAPRDPIGDAPVIRSAAAFVHRGPIARGGVASLLRRSAEFDVPDFRAVGPCHVLVPQSGADAAREVLLPAELIPAGRVDGRVVAPGRLLA